MKRAAILMVLLIGLGVFTWLRRPSLGSSTVVLEPAPVTEPLPTFSETKPRVEYAPLRSKVMTNPAALAFEDQRPVITNSFLPGKNANALVPESNTVADVETTTLPEPSVSSSSAAFNLCLSNMHQIVWAANVWCGVHGEVRLPGDLMLLTHELATPATLVCPGDPQWSQKAATNWAEFKPEWITYRVHPDALTRPNARVNVSFNYLCCDIHKRCVLGDRPSPPGGWGMWWDSVNPDKKRSSFK